MKLRENGSSCEYRGNIPMSGGEEERKKIMELKLCKEQLEKVREENLLFLKAYIRYGDHNGPYFRIEMQAS